MKRIAIGILGFGLVLAMPASISLAQENAPTDAKVSVQDQIKVAMEQLAKANEARNRAVQFYATEKEKIKDTPQQIEAMIDELKALNEAFDSGSQFRTALDDMEANVDTQISEVIDDPDPRLQEAVKILKSKIEKIAAIRKQTEALVEQGKGLVRKLEENRRVAAKLIAIEKIDALTSVFEEALAQYGSSLSEFSKIIDTTNSYFVSPNT
jgi:uncharacterized phage infection (PIP) family protein YhgE